MFVLCCYVTYASSNKTKIEMRQHFVFTQGGCISCLCACLGARLLPQSYQYPNLLEGTNRVSGLLHSDKECPFSGLTKSGRVWRMVPESDTQSVHQSLSQPCSHQTWYSDCCALYCEQHAHGNI